MAGDKGAILIGGLPNYRFYKQQALDRGLTEQEAIDEAIVKFENDTLRTQQSYDLQDKDYFQTKGAFYRAFNMFLTTPKQYFRREIIYLLETTTDWLHPKANKVKEHCGKMQDQYGYIILLCHFLSMGKYGYAWCI